MGYNAPTLKRLSRWLFNGVTVLSLLLCTAVVALWVRSYGTHSWAWEYLPSKQKPAPWTNSDWPRPRPFIGLDHFSGAADITWRPDVLSSNQGFEFAEAWSDSSSAQLQRQMTPYVVAVEALGYPGSVHSMLGVRYQSYSGNSGFTVSLPDGVIAVLFALLPAAWVLRRSYMPLVLRRRRLRLGLCSECGYDLRASNDRCPECGTPIVRYHQRMAVTELQAVESLTRKGRPSPAPKQCP